MEGTNLLQRKISEFKQYLHSEERSAGTIEKYLREVRAFCAWLDGQSVTKALVAAWKAHLLEQHYAPETVSSKLVALHAFLKFAGWEECRVKLLKIQRKLFRD